MDGLAEREGKQTFLLLKPLCTRLLEVSTVSPECQALLLERLCELLRDASSPGLQRCMDYTLFPLLLLLDAAVAGRSSESSSNLHSSGKNQMVRVGDRVAEAVLQCVEVVLRRCVLKTTAQVTMLLQKLTAAAMLSSRQASEEFRHGVVKCLQALLQGLRPCDMVTCVCKSVSASPFVAIIQDPLKFFNEDLLEQAEVEQTFDDVNACPMGYMQSESMSVFVGHLISLLLQIPEAEVARGAVGSGKLRRDALFTLRTLALKVGTADGLAFFLPKVASVLTKVMNSTTAGMLNVRSSVSTATVHTSGPVGWPAAVEEAIRGFTEILVIVLSDKNNACALGISSSAGPVAMDILDTHVHITAGAALETLEGLSAQVQHGINGPIVASASASTKKVEVILAQGHQKTGGITTVEGSESGPVNLPLRSERTKEWLDLTTTRVESLLLQTFPLLCAHQSPFVRLAVTEAAAILLSNCWSTLKLCTTMFLECLLALACDDREHVASAAQTYLHLLLAPSLNCKPETTSLTNINEDMKQLDMHTLDGALVRVTLSILDQLPWVVFSTDVSVAVLHVKRLAAAMYFLGPEGVSVQLLDTMVTKQKFIRTLSQCLSFNTTFKGSLQENFSSSARIHDPIVSGVNPSGCKDDSHGSSHQDSRPVDMGTEEEEPHLPSTPPWLSGGSGNKIYDVLVYVLRLAGLSAITDQLKGTSVVSLVDLLLVNIRQAAANVNFIGHKSASEDGSKSVQARRMAATQVCVLNEIIYGASGAWNTRLFSKFGDGMSCHNLQKKSAVVSRSLCSQFLTTAHRNSLQDKVAGSFDLSTNLPSLQRRWQAARKNEVVRLLSECAGNILQSYLATEIWEQPTDIASASLAYNAHDEGSHLVRLFRDNAMLQKVLMEGIGVLGLALGKAFEDDGYLGLVLFPLLEKLASANDCVRSAASMSLNTVCLHCQYTSVRDLVVGNVDLIMDSLCRQFRHIMSYPNVPNLLASILRHANVSADLLPLLEEPLCRVVLELDVLARRSRPELTVPLLRALREITRATSHEAGVLLSKAADASAYFESLLGTERAREVQVVGDAEDSGTKAASSTKSGSSFFNGDLKELLNHHVARKRFRHAVAAIATSCLVACGPLLTAKDPQPCLLALDTVEDCIATLSYADEAGVYETKEEDYIEYLCELVGYTGASDGLTSFSSKNENNSRKLLPSMNRLWPHLVLALRHLRPPVVIHAFAVIGFVTAECGGNFFTRRFQKDAVPIIVELLREGTYAVRRKKPMRPALLMPSTDIHAEESAPGTVWKVQEAILKGIMKIAASKKSATALEGTFGLVAACVIVSACLVLALRQVATDAMLALSKLDPDLVWVILADLSYGSDTYEFKGIMPSGFPQFNKIFPPFQSQQEALCVQYAANEVDLAYLNKIAAQNLLKNVEKNFQREIS